MIFSVFSYRSTAKAEGHYQENEAGDFKPELVQHASDGACRGSHRTNSGFNRAVAASLFAGHPRHNAGFLPSRNFAHGLDFNSLRGYNERNARRR
jgi:hypothetical protein